MGIMTDTEIQMFESRINETLDRLGINPKIDREWVSKTYAATVLGMGRKRLDTAIRMGRIRAKYNQKANRWKVMRKDVESFVNAHPRHGNRPLKL